MISAKQALEISKQNEERRSELTRQRVQRVLNDISSKISIAAGEGYVNIFYKPSMDLKKVVADELINLGYYVCDKLGDLATLNIDWGKDYQTTKHG